MRRKSLFRQSLFLGTLLFCLYSVAGENLPDIEAHQFDSTPAQISKTRRVYLFKTNPKDLPATGSILLVHDQGKPALAFRVLRTDKFRSQYVAKKVRRYDQTADLELKKSYFTVEKIADIISAPETSGPSDLAPHVAAAEEGDPAFSQPPADLSQQPIPQPAQQGKTEPRAASLTTNDPDLDSPPKPLDVESFDEELDGTTSPQTTDKNEEPEEPEEDVENESLHEIDETVILNPNNNQISIMLGIFRNLSHFVFSSENSLNGFILNYAKVINRDLFFLSKAPQDSLVLELGAAYYARVNGDSNNDSYSVVPIQAQLRYDLQFSQSFALMFYAGLQYNILTASANANEITKDNLTGPQQVFGIGLMFNLGPHWYLRTDLGWDKLTLGLSLHW